jgi:hypothetical protein
VNHAANSVTLRPFELRDADVMARWAADPEFCREADWTPGLPFSERQRFHRRLIQSGPSDLIRLGVIHRGVLVGYVDLHGDEPHRREIGFVIGERGRWGWGAGPRRQVLTMALPSSACRRSGLRPLIPTSARCEYSSASACWRSVEATRVYTATSPPTTASSR